MCLSRSFQARSFLCLKEGWVLYALLLDELGLVGGEESLLDTLQSLVETFDIVLLLAFFLLEMVV